MLSNTLSLKGFVIGIAKTEENQDSSDVISSSKFLRKFIMKTYYEAIDEPLDNLQNFSTGGTFDAINIENVKDKFINWRRKYARTMIPQTYVTNPFKMIYRYKMLEKFANKQYLDFTEDQLQTINNNQLKKLYVDYYIFRVLKVLNMEATRVFQIPNFESFQHISFEKVRSSLLKDMIHFHPDKIQSFFGEKVFLQYENSNVASFLNKLKEALVGDNLF